MKTNKPISFGFIIIAIILGAALYRQFDFATLKFERPALSVVYFIAFVISLFALRKNSKKQSKEQKNKIPEEQDVFKNISIRGRFAFGMICLENLIQHFNINNNLLLEIVEDYWRFTSSDKLGQHEDFFNTMSPDCILSDFPKLKENPEKLHDFGYDNISFEKMMSVFKLYKKLPEDLTSIMTQLSYIANSNISAGCGEFSSLTFDPTMKILEIMKFYPCEVTPKFEVFTFSKFEENHGWGNKFVRQDLKFTL